jgi:hypothetical protein
MVFHLGRDKSPIHNLSGLIVRINIQISNFGRLFGNMLK